MGRRVGGRRQGGVDLQGCLGLALVDGRRVVLGIVSNAQFYTPLILDAFPETRAILRRADPALCLWSFRLKEAKPSARIFALAARRLMRRHGIAPPEILYVGNDPVTDRRPALQAGFQFAYP